MKTSRSKSIQFLPAGCVLLIALSGTGLSPSRCAAQTLGEALNATNLTWTTSGTGNSHGWNPESTVTHDGISAAASWTLYTSSDSSILQTIVTGPGTLKFWWQNGSSYNGLNFRVGGTKVASLIANPSWQQQTVYLGDGDQILEWSSSKQISFPPGDNIHAYVDEVNYVAGATAPVITSQPLSQSQIPGCSTTFSVSAAGTPPLSWQWQFNGKDVSGATSSSLTVTNVQDRDLGNYSVTVSNAVGSVSSSNAYLAYGRVTSWGLSAYNATMTPPGATNVLALAAGDYFTYALRADGTILAWGFDPQGQVTTAGTLSNVVAVSAKENYCIVLRTDGTVLTPGDPAIIAPPLSNVVAVAAGMFHYLALTSDGRVVAWGSNSNGQTNVPPGLSNVVAIAAGQLDSLALQADGTVTQWGASYSPVPSLSNIVAIAAGAQFDLALTADGTVVGWGSNGYGQATPPSGLTNAIAIAAGDATGLALTADGKVISWGNNAGGLTNPPAALTNVISIAAGSYHDVALVGDVATKIRLSNALLSATGFSLEVSSQYGRVYGLEYKNSLDDESWTRLPLVAGSGTNVLLHDPKTSAGQRFYRVRRW